MLGFPKVYLASDHAGFELKDILYNYLQDNYRYKTIRDLGTFDDTDVDYPIYAGMVCTKVAEDIRNIGVLVCGSGIGMSIMANKYKGIRAALCRECEDAELSRLHNFANVICLGERMTDVETAKNILDTFINTKWSVGHRHERRVKMMEMLKCQ